MDLDGVRCNAPPHDGLLRLSCRSTRRRRPSSDRPASPWRVLRAHVSCVACDRVEHTARCLVEKRQRPRGEVAPRASGRRGAELWLQAFARPRSVHEVDDRLAVDRHCAMNRFRLMGDPYLRRLSPEQARAVDERIARWEVPAHEFERTLDRWFGNFEGRDKDLAFELLLNVDFYGPARFEARLVEVEAQVRRRALNLGLAPEPILVVVPDGSDDSSHRHAYDLAKAWGLPRSRIAAVSELSRIDVTDSILVLFNDTYGSGTQLLREVWPAVARLPRPARAVFLVAVAIAEEALGRFAKELPGVHVVPDTPAPNARSLFSAGVQARLRELGDRVYPKHPLGFGGTALLMAYYFQCPNNTLPLLWADGINNAVAGRAYPWWPLFSYRPKVKDPVDTASTAATAPARLAPTAAKSGRASARPPSEPQPALKGMGRDEIPNTAIPQLTDRVFGRDGDFRVLKQQLSDAAASDEPALRDDALRLDEEVLATSSSADETDEVRTEAAWRAQAEERRTGAEPAPVERPRIEGLRCQSFDHDDILDLHHTAIAALLVDSRDALLMGLDPAIKAALPLAPSPGARLLSDLTTLNAEGWLVGEGAPLGIWLANAIALSARRVETERFERALARLRAATPAGWGTPASKAQEHSGAIGPTPYRPALLRILSGVLGMGSVVGEGNADERPLHEVRLSSFLMAATPVTGAQYASLMGRSPAPNDGVSPDLPVVFVSWFDAVRYCNALSKNEGLAPAYLPDGEFTSAAADGYRLPMEAQWEYACRAGTTTAWCSGETAEGLDRIAWYGERPDVAVQPVRGKQPNDFGIFDMHGNVAEWCEDWYGPYSAEPQIDSQGPMDGSARVVRGGSIWCCADWVRSASRDKRLPRLRFRDVSFRVIRIEGARRR